MSDSLFGRELGLMHQVAVIGREVGADQSFWSIVASDKELLRKMVKMAKTSVKLAAEDFQAVTKWLATLDGDCPFHEVESYYANSSHSGYCDSYDYYHHDLATLFNKAQHYQKARGVCEEIECYFVLCYTLSAVWSWLDVPNVSKNRWLHDPSSGLFTTFHEVVCGDSRAPRGKHLTLQHFLDNEAVKLVEGVRAKYYDQFCAWCRRNEGGDDTPFPTDIVGEILGVCRQARDIQRAKIVSMIQQ